MQTSRKLPSLAALALVAVTPTPAVAVRGGTIAPIALTIDDDLIAPASLTLTDASVLTPLPWRHCLTPLP